MVPGNVVVAEKRLACNGVHVQRVQEAYILRQIRNRITLQLARERMVERNVDGAVTVFDVEDHGVATALMPASHQFNAASTTCARAGEIDRPDFTVFRKWPALFHNRL